MKQYKCKDCEYKWSAQEDPFECPKCHSASIEEANKKPTFVDAIKRYWWILVCAAVAAILIIVLMPKNATRVKVNVDSSIGRMEVLVKGKHASEYLVMVKQNEVIEKQAFTKESNPVIFMDLRGEYILELMYVGQGTVPKMHKYNKKYSFSMEGDDPKSDDVQNNDGGLTITTTAKPEIVELKPTPSRIPEGGSYTVIVVLSPYGCPEDAAQFSMDGQTWQDSPSFPGLKPGAYTFWARNKKMNDLVSESELVLEEAYSRECLTVAKANGLLSGIANGDSRSINEFKKYISNKTPVNGNDNIVNGYLLLLELQEDEAVNYSIIDIDCKDGVVKSITIKEK